jgi:3',5'-cyclic AMP phosphodiesterase CpdA
VLRALVEAGADLVLAGHIHQGAVSERHEFEVVGDEARTAVVAVAPGLGQPRPRRLGEARGVHLHEADADAIVVRTFRWSRGEWALAAERRFLR